MSIDQPLISRRRLLQLAGGLPIGALIAACGSADPTPDRAPSSESSPEAKSLPPAPTPTPEPPFVISGEERLQLMEGTPQQTPLYVFGSGQPGKILMVLGGVHGNEPGGWMAADRVVQRYRPARGAILVIPAANKLAMAGFVRTTDELGDLNRAYPGDPNGLPMFRMAYQIMQAIRDYHVDLVIDMHESWAFYKDRPQNGTAYLGQTVATGLSEPAVSFTRGVVEAVNTRVQSPWEEFFFRTGRLPNQDGQTPGDNNGNPQSTFTPPTDTVSVSNRSSLGIPNHAQGTMSILVEMGQQQALERRIALHVDVFAETARRLGILDA